MSKIIVRGIIKNERREIRRTAQESFCWLKRRGMSTDIKDYKTARENLTLFDICFGTVLS